MSQVNNSAESMVIHNLPRSLAASLDVEELERRLEMSEMLEPTEAEAMEYAVAAGWEVVGEVRPDIDPLTKPW